MKKLILMACLTLISANAFALTLPTGDRQIEACFKHTFKGKNYLGKMTLKKDRIILDWDSLLDSGDLEWGDFYRSTNTGGTISFQTTLNTSSDSFAPDVQFQISDSQITLTNAKGKVELDTKLLTCPKPR